MITIAPDRTGETVTRHSGLAAGLAHVLSTVDIRAVAPGRWAAVPAALVPAGAQVRTDRLATYEEIVFIDCPEPRPAGSPALLDVGRRLVSVRLGLIRQLLDLGVAHLDGRTSGGASLLSQQLITGDIADVIGGFEPLRAAVGTAVDPRAVLDLHSQLDDLGWRVAKLFGAAGYLAEHPARALYVAMLAVRTWLPEARPEAVAA